MIKNYGLIEDEIVISDDDYLLGALSQKVVNESGNWEKWLPVYEPQASKYETFGCTAWATLNQVECYLKHATGTEFNYSDRFTYILANISPPGAPPSRAYEAIRKKGVIDDLLLPYADTYDEFLQPNPMMKNFLRKGLDWLSNYKFFHEWVKNPTHDKLKEALKYSPVCVSVTAWIEEGGLYVDKGQKNTHWTMLFKYDGDSPVIFDSYDNSIKKLHPDHKIKFAKRILITKTARAMRKRPMWLNWFNLFKIYKINIK